MKNLLLMAAMILAVSCSSVHKVTTESKKTSDSVSTVIKDTLSVSKKDTKSDNFTAKGVDIVITYGVDTLKKSSDSVVWSPFYYKPNKDDNTDNKINEIINDAVSKTGLTGKIPSTISIHIDSIGDSTVENSTTDSVKGKTSIVTYVKKKLTKRKRKI